MASSSNLSDVFISYSRKDSGFVRKLDEALIAKGHETWVDWENIPLTADWWEEIQNGIEGANTFIFVISPDSVSSDICYKEIEHAVKNHKRFVPILHREVQDANIVRMTHPVINSHNWVMFREQDNFDEAFQSLMRALNTDLDYVRSHTRILVRANQWVDNKQDASFLLTGTELREAEAWLRRSAGHEPKPTELQTDFILESQNAQARRQRRLLAGVSVAFIISLGLAALSFFLFQQAETQRWLAVQAQAIADENAVKAEANAAKAIAAQSTSDVNLVLAEGNAVRATIELGRAQEQAAIAVAAQATADANAQLAQMESERANSAAFAVQASFELNGLFPERAIHLAIHALENFQPTVQAQQALLLAIQQLDDTLAFSGHEDDVLALSWSPDSSRIVSLSADNAVIIWDVASQRELLQLNREGGRVNDVAWSPDGSRIALGYADGQIEMRNFQTNTPPITLTAHTGGVNGVMWSPDGNLLLTAGMDNTARIWDSTDGALVTSLIGHTSIVNDAIWSPDGSRILTVSNDTTGKIWSYPDARELVTLSGHVQEVNVGAWSPDGALVVTAGGDQVVKAWDAEEGQLLLTNYGHRDDVTGIAWSPEGSQIATVSLDETVRIWNLDPLIQPLVYANHADAIHDVAWSSDGKGIATASSDNSIRIWRNWLDIEDMVLYARNCCIKRILTDEENTQLSLPLEPSELPPPELPTCEGVLASRLYENGRGQVNGVQDVILHDSPAVLSQPVVQLSPGQKFHVIEGPVCADEQAWFRVLFGATAVEGWITESANDQYLVGPVLE